MGTQGRLGMTNDQQGSDLGAIFDAHVCAEFEQQDVDATMATMVDDPYLNHVPTMTGGTGGKGVRDFYANHFIGRWPGDTKLIPISRTVGTSQVVDEFVLTFTHDTEIDVLLPGVAPTGRRVELPHIVVMGVREGKVTPTSTSTGIRGRSLFKSASLIPAACRW